LETVEQTLEDADDQRRDGGREQAAQRSKPPRLDGRDAGGEGLH
jgi:hypothetical protein